MDVPFFDVKNVEQEEENYADTKGFYKGDNREYK